MRTKRKWMVAAFVCVAVFGGVMLVVCPHRYYSKTG